MALVSPGAGRTAGGVLSAALCTPTSWHKASSCPCGGSPFQPSSIAFLLGGCPPPSLGGRHTEAGQKGAPPGGHREGEHLRADRRICLAVPWLCQP